MKIARIAVYQLAIPLIEDYVMSGGRVITSYDTTLVRIDTDADITGWAEVCPLGPAYLPAYAAGARAGVAELAPHLLGKDPLDLGLINETMDGAMRGHPYVKSPIDIACWDIVGKVAGLPLCLLLGGRYGSDFPVYWSVSQGRPDEMVTEIGERRAQGIRSWQLKVGGRDTDVDIERIRAALTATGEDQVVLDANGGWLSHQALRIAHAYRDCNVAIEQPCESYEECLAVRRATSLPFVLDEVIDGVGPFARAHSDGAMDVVNIKIGKVGGLTKAKLLRDLCVNLGIAVTIEDMPGGDITGASILHLAHSTPERYRFSVTSSYLKVREHIAEGGPVVHGGRTAANDAPGLGVEPHADALRNEIFSIAA